MRKRIEAVISELKKLFPRTIHVVTLNGFIIKLTLFLFGLKVNKIFKQLVSNSSFININTISPYDPLKRNRMPHFRVTTNSDHLYPVNENLLLCDFSTTHTGQKWISDITDITYIRTGEGGLYLTIIMDLEDRKIIGWSRDSSMSAGSTVVAAWAIAVKNRPVTKELIFHSDRGIQYTSHEFRRCFKHLPVLQSMSRKGNCWDNAVAESFFKTLKTEMGYHTKFETRAQARLEIFDYIEVWYNRKRKVFSD